VSKRRQFQVTAIMPSGAVMIFGVGARSEPAAMLRARQTLAEIPSPGLPPQGSEASLPQVTLQRIYWRGMRWTERAARREGPAAPPPSQA